MALRSAVLSLVAALVCAFSCAQKSSLKLERVVFLPGVEGRIDHLSADIEGGRVFVSALGNGTVEVVDIAHGQRTGEIKGLKEPQGVLNVSSNHMLYIATGGDGMVRAYNARTLALAGSIALGDDADNIRYDSERQSVVVGYGEGALAVLPLSLKSRAEVPVPVHPESFQFSGDGAHVFVNLPNDESIAVIDLNKMAVTAKWRHLDAQSNFPMAVDSDGRRVFVVCRTPAQLLELNESSGSVTQRINTVGDADDLFFDEERGRAYVIGGEGFVDVVEAHGSSLTSVERVPTASGARTGMLVPAWNELIVAAPHRGADPARLLVYALP